MHLRDLRFIGVDADERGAFLFGDAFAVVADGGDCFAGADFDDDEFAAVLNPVVECLSLAGVAGALPVPVVKHEDVGAGDASALRAAWRGVFELAGVFVDVGLPTVG